MADKDSAVFNELNKISGDSDRHSYMLEELLSREVEIPEIEQKDVVVNIPDTVEVNNFPAVQEVHVQNTDSDLLKSILEKIPEVSEPQDYTEMLRSIAAILKKNDLATSNELLKQISEKDNSLISFPEEFTNKGRIKVEVDRTGGSFRTVASADGTTINPATEDKQDAIIAALGGGIYKKEIDIVAPITYIGEAQPATATSSANWRIKKIDETLSPDISITWAGTGVFNQIWDDRVSLTYN